MCARNQKLTSKLDELLNRKQFSSVNKVIANVTKMQSSGKLKKRSTETTAEQGEPHVPSALNDLTNEAKSSDGNSTVWNVTELQPSVNKTVEEATLPDERTSTPKDSSNEMQPSVVNRVDDNGTEIQFSDVETTAVTTLLEELPSPLKDVANEGMHPSGVNRTVDNSTTQEERTSTLKDSSNEILRFDENRENDIGAEMQFSGVKTTAETTILGELPSTPMDVTNEGQSSSGNTSTVENVTEMQHCGVNKIIENTTVQDERTSIPKDSSSGLQPFGPNRVHDNDTEMQFSGVNKTAESTALGELLSTPEDPSNEGQSSGWDIRTVENASEMQCSGVNKTIENATVPDERTSTCIPKASSNDAQPSGVNRVDGTQAQSSGETEINTSVSDFNGLTVSCVTTNSSASGEIAFTQKGTSSTPLADFNEPSISLISMEEIQSTLKCVPDIPVSDLNPQTVLCDMIVETASSCSAIELSTESLLQIEDLLKDISESVISATVDGRFTESPSTQELNQPPRKKIKLSRSVNIPVEDVLCGVHTRLCGCNCTSRHSPLVLAVSVQNDCKLRTCLENHLKLSIKNGWRSSVSIHDPSTKLHQLVFNLAVLFGKLDLLEFMLKAQLEHSQYLANTARNSPVTTLLKNMHRFMPTSSFDEKLSVFQQVLQLFVQYDNNALMVKDNVSGDTILHVCAKQIRELTNEIKARESVAPDFLELQGLLDQRMLCEKFCTEMIHMFKRLGVEGPLHQSQVLELLDTRNKSGETMSKILQDEELTRKSCYVGSCQMSSPAQEDGNTECTRKLLLVDKEHCEGKRTEGDAMQLTIDAKTSSMSQTSDLQRSYPTGQNVTVSTNVIDPSGTTTSSLSKPGNTGAQPGHHIDLTTLRMDTESPTGSETDSADEGNSPSQSPDPSSSDTEAQLASGHHIDLPTLQVNTASPLPESYVIPTGNHTFVCSPNCSFEHHDLIQLLCATPDHSSIITPADEIKSCSNFRTYLKDSSWDLNDVIPDQLPKLCYSIIHLACLLGKYKALEVLSEFGFHPLIHTAIIEETPLHMTVRLLLPQSLGSLFMCNAVISIFKTLNRHSHAISLFSAKDYKGNTVLHLLARMILPNKSVSETTVIVYLFRVFVHFLLKGQNSSPSVTCQILSSALQDCNKAGESVETLLQKTVVGKQLWMYLTRIMKGSVSAGVSSKVLDTSNDEALNQRKEDNTTEMEEQTPPFGLTQDPSAITRDDSSWPRHTNSDEPESLIDFVLSHGGGIIKNSDAKALTNSYHREYQKRLQFLQSKVLSLQKELKSAKQIEQSLDRLEKDEKMLKSSIKWNKMRMQVVIEERKEQKEQLLLNNERLQLLKELKQDIQHWECNKDAGVFSRKR